MNTISYSSVIRYKENNNMYSRSAGEKQNSQGLSKCAALRQQIRDLSNENSKEHKGYLNESVISSIKKYSETIQNQRTKTQDTSLSKKKLKYSFKSISSKIIRSKTSVAARQVVAQAKREVQRLKREQRSGKYDADEIEEALSHAKTMERIARKKVKHLEEEEMAQRKSGVCAGERVEENDSGKEEDYDEIKDEESGEDDVENEESGDEYNDVYGSDFADFTDDYSSAGYAALSTLSEKFEEFEEMTEELLSEYEGALKEMFEEMDLSELTDSLLGATGEMDSQDIKELQMKHRNKEMKEIVKADAEYLKALFQQLEKEKSGGVSLNGAVGASSISSPVSVSITVPSECFTASGSQIATSGADCGGTIDVSV